jgi:transposase
MWGFIMVPTKPTIEINMQKLDDVLRRVEANELTEDDCQTIRTLVASYVHLTELLRDKNTSLARLRKMLFGASSERTRMVLGDEKAAVPPPTAAEAAAESARTSPENADNAEAAPRPGHGRNGADAYSGAEKTVVPHESLQPGDHCPQCAEGTVYETGRPGVLVRLVGQAPIQAKVYELQKLRCNLCGVVFTAQAPEGVGTAKYDATAGSMIALLKYGSGMPFHREEKLQASVGIPLPASTQWEIVRDKAEKIEPAYEELVRQAAQGDVVHNDDTTVKILALMGERAKEAEEQAPAKGASDEAEEDSSPAETSERRGMFTSGIVSTKEGRRIALFFSGRKHAGENLADVLAARGKELPPPIQMCDALSRNLPGQLQTILSHCLAHGRRRFVEVADRFPNECRHVLESLAVVYGNDAIARERKLSPAARRCFHQTESGPVMEELHAWLVRQLEERLVEPNSALGQAISHLLKHWEKLTLFLRVPGAPLDNNICEQALKRAILHRKNALFYRTSRGAHVGDLFMSLIQTCALCGVNPFDYLTALERHAEQLPAKSKDWMPWNYHETLKGTEDAETPTEEDRL